METREIKADAGEILIRLAKLQVDMNYVKEHIDDITLTENDLISIQEAKEDLRERKTKRL